jgi:hypothetical protein
MSIKLNDTQLVLLSAASQRDDHYATLVVFDDRGNRMSPTWARKGPKRWRYYVSQAALQGDRSKAGSVARVPAADVAPVGAANPPCRPRKALSPRFGLSISWAGKRNFVGRAEGIQTVMLLAMRS